MMKVAMNSRAMTIDQEKIQANPLVYVMHIRNPDLGPSWVLFRILPSLRKIAAVEVDSLLCWTADA